MLQKNDMIYSLDLSGNSIEDYGAEKLCRVLLVNIFVFQIWLLDMIKKNLIYSPASSFNLLLQELTY